MTRDQLDESVFAARAFLAWAEKLSNNWGFLQKSDIEELLTSVEELTRKLGEMLRAVEEKQRDR
jgi:hypothetical protein